MTYSRKLALVLLVLVSFAACSGSKGRGNSSTTSGPRGRPACSKESAKESSQFIVEKDGFSVTCAKVTKGTDISFINGMDAPAQVSLSHSPADDFVADLPNNGSTYAHRFDTPGTFIVASNPDSMLTLFVTD